MAWTLYNMIVTEEPGEGVRIRANVRFTDNPSGPTNVRMHMPDDTVLDLDKLMGLIAESDPPVGEWVMGVVHADESLETLTFVAFDDFDDSFGQAGDLPPGKHTMIG